MPVLFLAVNESELIVISFKHQSFCSRKCTNKCPLTFVKPICFFLCGTQCKCQWILLAFLLVIILLSEAGLKGLNFAKNTPNIANYSRNGVAIYW